MEVVGWMRVTGWWECEIISAKSRAYWLVMISLSELEWMFDFGNRPNLGRSGDSCACAIVGSNNGFIG